MFTHNVKTNSLLNPKYLLLVFFALCSTLIASKIPSDTILAEYNGGYITKADFDNEFYKIPQMFRSKYATNEGRKELLEAIVLNRLSYYEALEMGIDTNPDTFSDYEDKLKPYYASMFRRREISENIKITEQEIKNYYKQNIEFYTVTGNIIIKHIMLDDENYIDSVVQDLNGSTDYLNIVNRYSVNEYSKGNNGMIADIRSNGFIRGIGRDFDLYEKIVSSPKKQWVGPFKTQSGIHFFNVQEVIPDKTKPFEQVKHNIESTLTRIKERTRKSEIIESLKNTHNVTINENTLEKVNLLDITPFCGILNEIVITADTPEMTTTVEDIYNHFRSISPYITNDDITADANYYTQFRHLPREEWMDKFSPEALNRLVNNIIEVNLFDYEARKKAYEDPQLENPELLLSLSEPVTSEYDQAVLQHPEVNQLRRHIILKNFFQQRVIDKVDPTTDDLKNFYEDNLDRYTTKEHLTVRLFMFQSKNDAKQARAMAKEAQNIDNRQEYEEKMREIIAPSLFTNRGGTIPYIYKNQPLPVFGYDKVMLNVFWSTELGELSDIHQNNLGLYFFIEGLDHYPSYTYSFDYLKDHLTDILTYDNRLAGWIDLTQELMDKYSIVMYPERLSIVLSANELFSLAEEAQNRNRFKDAINYYETIITNHQNNNDDYRALFMKAFLLARELEDYTNAVEIFQKLINDYPQDDLHESAEFMIKSILND